MRGVRWVGDDSHFLLNQKLLDVFGSVSRGVVMMKQPGLFSLKFGATSSHVFTHSPQNIAVKSRIHSLACWDECFALPQLPCRWRHQSGIFWILLVTGMRCAFLAVVLFVRVNISGGF
jgi:hypothetical protein